MRFYIKYIAHSPTPIVLNVKHLPTFHRSLEQRREDSIAIYHLAVRAGTRAKGSVAAKKSDYIQRENQYQYQEDKCFYRESDHMPSWAKDEPRDYWQAADEFERVNGRLYVEVEFALPKELDKEAQINLAHDYAQALTNENHLPYTMALHEGQGSNPHCHLIISERINDGIERDAGDWFKRANSLEPEQGGAMKSREFHGGHTITEVRELWAEKANDALEKGNSLERIDHRSLEDQGIDRTPTQHIGRASWSMAERGIESDRFKELQAIQERAQGLEREERHAERQVERELRNLTREAELEQGGRSRDNGLEHSGGAGIEQPDKQQDKQSDKQHERDLSYGLEL